MLQEKSHRAFTVSTLSPPCDYQLVLDVQQTIAAARGVAYTTAVEQCGILVPLV